MSEMTDKAEPAPKPVEVAPARPSTWTEVAAAHPPAILEPNSTFPGYGYGYGDHDPGDSAGTGNTDKPAEDVT